MDPMKSQLPCRLYIPDIIIYIDRVFRIDMESIDKQLIDIRERFANLFFTRDQSAIEPMQKIIQFQRHGKGLGGPIGQGV